MELKIVILFFSSRKSDLKPTYAHKENDLM